MRKHLDIRDWPRPEDSALPRTFRPRSLHPFGVRNDGRKEDIFLPEKLACAKAC